MTIEDSPQHPKGRSIRIIFDSETGEFIVEPGLDANALPTEQIFALKPKGTGFTDAEWLILTRILGIAKASAKAFKLHFNEEYRTGRVPTIPPRVETPGMSERIILGEAGKLGFQATGGDFKQFIEFMGQHEWKPEQLGLFGQWVIQSGINPRFMRPILDSYLRD